MSTFFKTVSCCFFLIIGVTTPYLASESLAQKAKTLEDIIELYNQGEAQEKPLEEKLDASYEERDAG